MYIFMDLSFLVSLDFYCVFLVRFYGEYSGWLRSTWFVRYCEVATHMRTKAVGEFWSGFEETLG